MSPSPCAASQGGPVEGGWAGGAAWGLGPEALLAVLGALMSTYKGQTQLGQASQPWPLRPGERGGRKERRAGTQKRGLALP